MSITTEGHPLGILKAQHHASVLVRIVSWIAAIILVPIGIWLISVGLKDVDMLVNDPVKICLGVTVVLLSGASLILAIMWTRFRLQLREHGLSYRSLLKNRQFGFDDLADATARRKKTETIGGEGELSTKTSYWLTLKFSDERQSCLKIHGNKRAFDFFQQVVHEIRTAKKTRS